MRGTRAHGRTLLPTRLPGAPIDLQARSIPSSGAPGTPRLTPEASGPTDRRDGYGTGFAAPAAPPRRPRFTAIGAILPREPEGWSRLLDFQKVFIPAGSRRRRPSAAARANNAVTSSRGRLGVVAVAGPPAGQEPRSSVGSGLQWPWTDGLRRAVWRGGRASPQRRDSVRSPRGRVRPGHRLDLVPGP